MSSLTGLSSNLLSSGLVLVLSFANQIVIARGLGPEGRGHLGLVATSVMFGGLFLGEWLNRGNTYAAGVEGRTGGLVGNTLLFGGLVGAAALGAAGVAPGLGPLAFLDRAGYLLAAGIFAATLVQRAGQAIILGEDRMGTYASLPVLFVGTYLAGTALALHLWRTGLTGVLTAWMLAIGLSLAATLVGIGGGLRPRARPDWPLLGRTAAVGGRGGASATLVFLLSRSDVYLVGYFLGDAQLGVYMIAVVLAGMILRLPNVAGVVLLPKVLGGKDTGHGLSLRVARDVLLFSLVAAGAAVVMGRPAIGWLLPAEFAGAYEPLVWMLPGLVACGFASILNTKLAGQGYPPIVIWAPAVAVVAKVALSAALIPAMGLEGAGLATTVAYSLWAAIVTCHYRRAVGADWSDLLAGGMAGAGPRVTAGGRVWLTWHHARRSRSLASRLGVVLCECFIDRGPVVRHGLSSLWTLWVLLRRRPRAICLQYSFLLLVLAAAYKRAARWPVRLVCDCHTKALRRSVTGRWGGLFWVLKRWSFRAADLGVVANEGLRPALAALTPHGLVLADPFPDLGPARSPEEDEAYCVFVCSYAADEPLEEVIAAARLLAGDLQVVCTGRIPAHRADLRSQPHANIRFTDFVSDDEFARLLAGAACALALTTEEDCLMSAGYEAVALGVPPVVTDTAALRAFFETGAVFVQNSAASIAAGVREAAKRRDHLLAEMARVRVRRQAEMDSGLAALREGLDR